MLYKLFPSNGVYTLSDIQGSRVFDNDLIPVSRFMSSYNNQSSQKSSNGSMMNSQNLKLEFSIYRHYIRYLDNHLEVEICLASISFNLRLTALLWASSPSTSAIFST